MLITVVIGIYYPAIIAWAIRYAGFSIDKAWGDDPETFLFGTFLQAAETPGPTFDVVPGVLIPMIVVWAIKLGVLALASRAASGGPRSSSSRSSSSPSRRSSSSR